MVLGKICFEGANGIQPDRLILFTSGMEGMQLDFEFDHGWDEFPYKEAVFFACDLKLRTEIVENTAVIPTEILARPYTKVYIGVCGLEWNPDPETKARRAEIVARMNTIICDEIKTATDDTVGALMAEYSALHEEFEALGGTCKRMPSVWVTIGRVVPGVNPDIPDDNFILCH